MGRRRGTARLLLLGASLALCVAVSEAVLQSLEAAPSRTLRDGREKHRFSPYRADGVLGYALRPRWRGVHETRDFTVAVTTNDLGLRGRPATREKSPGRFRILVLGDSFAFGFGVEDAEAFPVLLERELAGAGADTEVLNAAVPGYSAVHHWLFLHERGLALEPDLVLVATCENDVMELGWNRITLGADRLPLRTQSRVRFIDHRGRMRYVDPEGRTLPALLERPPRWLVDHSRLFNWIRFRAAKMWTARAMAQSDARRASEAGAAPTAAISELTAAEIARGLFTGSAFRLRYHRFLVQGIAAALAASDVPLRFVHIGPGPGLLPRECARLGPHCLDLSQLFTRESHPEAFHPNDGHWTAEGHARIAAALARWLIRDPALKL